MPSRDPQTRARWSGGELPREERHRLLTLLFGPSQDDPASPATAPGSGGPEVHGSASPRRLRLASGGGA